MIEENELPKAWKLVKLREVLSTLESGKRPKGGVQGIESGIPSIGAEHLNSEGGFKFSKIKFVPKEFADSMQRGKIRLNDIIVVKDGATTGKTSFVGKDYPFDNSVINEHVFICRTVENVDSKYIFYNMFSEKGKDQILEDFRGAAQGGISSKFVDLVKIPLPPLAEQQRIIAKLEELLSELEKGKEQLHTALDQLKVYRQAVLKYAFEGKLTEEWRKQKKELPSVEELRKQLRNEIENKVRETGKKLKPIPPILENELASLPTLPKNWYWGRMGEVLWSVKDGPHYSPKYQKIGIPFISGGNVSPEGIDFRNTKFISKVLHKELSLRCKPELNDVLYTKGGTTGIARVNTYKVDFNVWVHVAVLKTVNSFYPFYLQHALNSNHCYTQSQKYTHGVGNQDLGLTRMILITLPICSFEEQLRVVEEIESRLSVADKLEETITASLQQSETLRQSILKKAFEGGLV